MNNPYFAAAKQKVWLLGVAAMLVLLFAGAGTVFADPTVMPQIQCPVNMNSCTASDLVTAVENAVPVNNDTCENSSDTITLDLSVSWAPNANKRYDVGFFISTNGQPVNNNGNACVGSIAPIGAGETPPGNVFANLDGQTGDICGDVSAAAPVTWAVRTTLPCVADANNNLVVQACRVWDNNIGVVCTNLADAGTGSKCDCTPLTVTQVNVPFDAKITVNKVVAPLPDAGKFNLQIDDVTKGTGGNVGDGGTTGTIIVGAGTLLSPGATHKVGETAGTDTSLANYASSITCVKAGGGTVGPIAGTSMILPVAKDDIWTCTITNTRKQGTIIVKKIAVSKAGVDYCPGRVFGFSLDTTIPTTFGLKSNVCDPTSTVIPYLASYTVPVGAYKIAETDSDINSPPNGWTLLNTSTCTSTGSNVWSVDLTNKWATGSVADGETIECTFVNKQDSDLAVTLESLAAQVTGTNVNVAWQTVSDISTRGFNLHRAESEAGPWTRLNATLIPVVALGSTSGNAYAWTDTAVAPGTHWYRMDDVSLSGAITSHPAVRVVVDAPTSVGLVGLGATPALGTAMPLAAIGISLLTGFAVARRRRR